jgi:prolipoprotein diacylglyceryl transferase
VLDLASIPSPSSNQLGPLHMYGLMIAIGVVVAVELGRSRWKARGGNPDDVYAIAFWAVPAGLVGARLYHVITDWDRLYSSGRWADAFKVWEGGLGIPGGMAAGIATGVWVAHRRGWRLSVGLDALIPGIALAQAIGRVGNWWNQVLVGGPSSLPWGVEIDPAHRPPEHIASSTFQPTFLYEMLWNLALFGFLIWIDRKRTLRPGNILPLYVGGYFLGRLWVEALRIDTASEILGLRVNIWLSILGIGGAIIVLVARGLKRRPDDAEEPYLDGHRWTPPGSAEQVADRGETDEVEPGGEPDGDPDTDAEADRPTGTALRGTRRRSSARSLNDEPAEDPPPT